MIDEKMWKKENDIMYKKKTKAKRSRKESIGNSKRKRNKVEKRIVGGKIKEKKDQISVSLYN